MDVVYIVKSDSVNDELRHSLRTLKNLPHDEVHFAGYKPSWARNVNRISTVQPVGLKHPNSVRNWRAALESDKVSDPFIVMNDDHFVMKKQAQMPVLNWGKVKDVLNIPTLGNTFKISMRHTLGILNDLGFEDPISYQLHVPLIIHKEQMLKVMDEYPNTIPGIWIQYVTIAGNLFEWGGETYERDVKIFEEQEIPSWMKRSAFLSTTDRSFQYGQVGSYIRGKFNTKSIYEV